MTTRLFRVTGRDVHGELVIARSATQVRKEFKGHRALRITELESMPIVFWETHDGLLTYGESKVQAAVNLHRRDRTASELANSLRRVESPRLALGDLGIELWIGNNRKAFWSVLSIALLDIQASIETRNARLCPKPASVLSEVI